MRAILLPGLVKFCPSVLLLLAGCATSDFTPYVGAQRIWPTSSAGALVRSIDGVPVYSSLPAQPYEVLGQVEVIGHPAGVNSTLTAAAKRHKADGVLLLDVVNYSEGSLNTGSAQTFGQTTVGTSVNVSGKRKAITGYLIKFIDGKAPALQ